MFYKDFQIALWIGCAFVSYQFMQSGQPSAIPFVVIVTAVVHLVSNLLVYGIARALMSAGKRQAEQGAFTMQDVRRVKARSAQAANQPVITEGEMHSLLLRTDRHYRWSWGDENTPGSMAYRNRTEKLEVDKLTEQRKTKKNYRTVDL